MFDKLKNHITNNKCKYVAVATTIIVVTTMLITRNQPTATVQPPVPPID